MRQRLLFLVAVIGFSLAASFSFAQAGRGGSYPQQNSLAQAIYWIGSEQMQKELDILPEQNEKLNKIRGEMQTRTQAAYKAININEVPPEERAAKYQEVTNSVGEETAKLVEGVLLPHQLKRLKQIMTQTRMAQLGYGGGSAVLASDDLSEELGITEEQKEELKKKEAEVRQEIQQKTQEFYKKLQEEAREKIFSVLTPSQRKKLEEIQGERFEWKFQQPAVGK